MAYLVDGGIQCTAAPRPETSHTFLFLSLNCFKTKFRSPDEAEVCKSIITMPNVACHETVERFTCGIIWL
jgi:aromatic ring-opening dioxygenase catalytic subunit (LigB family)